MSKISVGIDVGTSYIKIVVTENKKSESGIIPTVIGTAIAESKGLRYGYIVNKDDAVESIKKAVSIAEKNAGIRIRSVRLAVGGVGLGSIISKASVIISKADNEITDLDLKKLEDAAGSEVPLEELANKKILHTIPIAYKIDDKAIHGRPLGMHGSKIDGKFLVVTCLEQHLEDLYEALDEAGLDVLDDPIASPFAGTVANLTSMQKIPGCALVNIGAETTTLVIYENNIPVHLEVFQIGSNEITNDLALSFKIPIDEAEKIKMNGNTENNYSKKKFYEIVFNRLGEILENIEYSLKKIGRNGLLPAGIILTGGGSQFDITEEAVRETLHLPAKFASMNVLKNTDPKNQSLSIAYGLSILGLSRKESSIPMSINKQSVFDWIGKKMKRIMP